jgi:ParB/RepB/Spo0J family partition protein
MTAAALAKTEDVVLIPVAAIHPPTIPNYRKHMNEAKLEELAASIREVGVLSPLVFRQHPDGLLELVFGARRLEAAQRAGFSAVPGVVREYDDEQVREARLIENAQREDADPLDEAEAFAELHRLGHSVAGIAAKIGQSQAYVAQRLKLTGLSAACRAALVKGDISIGVAVLLAALPSTKLQNEGLEDVSASSHYDGRLMTVADARAELESSVMMRLEHAPFKTDDAELVPAAGSCLTCPKRTGGQALLFADASSPDLCTDKLCYRSKQDAAWKIRQKDAKAAGLNVLGVKEGDEALKRLSYGDSPYVRLDSERWDGKRHVKVAKVLGKTPPELTIARDSRSGLEVQLVPKKLFEAAAAKASKADPKADRSAPDSKAKAEREAEKVQAEVRRRTMVALVDACDAQCRKGTIPRPLLRLLVRGALVSTWSEIAKRVADRRGLPLTDEGTGTPKKGARRQLAKLAPTERIERLLPQLDEGALAALLLELMMGRAAPGKWSEGADCYRDLCSELGVNPKGIEVTVKSERKSKSDTRGMVKKPEPKLVHQFVLGGHGACGKAKEGDKLDALSRNVTCPGCKAAAKKKKADGKKPAKKAARPEHPATGLDGGGDE